MTSTTEDYLKRIMAESERTGNKIVSLGRLALLSGVTPGTVTTMMKSLAEAGLVEYFPRSGVRLTPSGIANAIRILRRHRLIELFLVETLGFDWSEVHEDAELLEHAVSDRVINRIDEFLNYPVSDPHGDPIPAANGTMHIPPSRLLSDSKTAGDLLITRITNDEPSFLDFLKREGLIPGRMVTMNRRDDDAGTILLSADGKDVTISLSVATKIYVASP